MDDQIMTTDSSIESTTKIYDNLSNEEFTQMLFTDYVSEPIYVFIIVIIAFVYVLINKQRCFNPNINIPEPYS
jgi:hypothetical protein